MRSSTFLSLAATISSALAVSKGFNYGSTFTDGSSKVEADFENEFNTAKGLVGASGFTSARLYTMIQGGTTDTVISAIPAAISSQTTLLLGLWASAGQADIANEITALTNAINQYGTAFTDLVVGISVGSEDLYRISPTGVAALSGAGAEPSDLVSYISQVRSAISGTSLSGAAVGHVDTWTAWVNGTNDAVISACDFLGMDAYPYFQNTQSNAIASGPSLFSSAYQATVGNAQGKPVWVTETGWPVSGPTENLAVAGTANAQTYWDEVGCDQLFDKVNTWWYVLQDAAPTTPSPSFGVVGSTLSTTPLYNLTCPAGSSGSSSSSSAASSTATSISSSVASATQPTTVPASATSSVSENPVPSASLGTESASASAPASSASAASVPVSASAGSASAASSSAASSSAAGTVASVTVAPASSATSAATTAVVTTGSSVSVSAGETLTIYHTTLITITSCSTVCQTTLSTASGSAPAPASASASASSVAPASSAASSAAGTSSAAASPSACPADIAGDYQYPHLIVPVSSSSPSKALGTQYNGTINSDVSTIFNFDIPQSYAGKSCSLVFLFPELSQLETSSYSFNNQGGIVSHVLASAANASTTFDNQPSEVLQNGAISSLKSGNSYVISSDKCPPGATVSFELSATGGLDLEFFEDYNPSPLGLYVRAC